MSGLLRTLPAIGTIVLPVAAVAALLPAVFAHPHRFRSPTSRSAAAHVAVALVAYALFLVAAVQALVLMGLEKRLHSGFPIRGRDSVPPLLTLERFLFRLVTAGFALLTLTLVSGMLFSEQVFGRPSPLRTRACSRCWAGSRSARSSWGRWRYGWRGRIALRWIIAGTVFAAPRLPRQQVRARGPAWQVRRTGKGEQVAEIARVCVRCLLPEL